MSEKKDEGSNYLYSAALAVVVIALVKCIAPSAIPFDIFGFWVPRGTASGWITTCLLLMGLGVGLNFLLDILGLHKGWRVNYSAREVMGLGFLVSLWAGVAEEISFRWLIFLAGIVLVKIANFLFFGCIGLGLPELIHVHILGHLANWSTFGFLEPYLFHGAGWAVGCGLLWTNAAFRDGHKYQGFIGVVNAWFIGMIMFWVLFNYGLLACILFHFLYDLAIFAYRALTLKISRGW